MNNSINYSGFVEMVLDSSDDFEPYGYAELPESVGNVLIVRAAGHHPQSVDEVLDE